MSQFAGQNQDGTYGNYNMPYNFSKESMAEFLKKSSASKTPVICKDGTTDFSLSSPNARYDNSKVCANNGGRAENQTIAEVKNPYEVTCKDGTKDVGNGKNPPCIYNGGRAETGYDPKPDLSMIGKYKVNKRTSIYKKNPNKKDVFGDVGTDIIGSLNVGDVVEVAELGGGGRGIAMTPYLIFNDGSYIIGYDADKVDNSTPITLKPQLFIEKNKTNLLIAGAVVLGYFAYKKFIK